MKIAPITTNNWSRNYECKKPTFEMLGPPGNTLKDFERITDNMLGEKGRKILDKAADKAAEAIVNTGKKIYKFFKNL